MFNFLLAFFGSLYYGTKLTSEVLSEKTYNRKQEECGKWSWYYRDKCALPFNIGYRNIKKDDPYLLKIAKEEFNVDSINDLFELIGEIPIVDIAYSRTGKIHKYSISNGYNINIHIDNDIRIAKIKAVQIIEKNLNEAGVDIRFVMAKYSSDYGSYALVIDKTVINPIKYLW